MSNKDERNSHDLLLEQVFDAAKSEASPVSEVLINAILRDAETVQKDHLADTSNTTQQSNQTSTRGFWQDLVQMFGGWQGMTGMATATIAGVWIGVAGPMQLENISGGLMLTDEYALLNEASWIDNLSPSSLSETILMEEDG